MGSTADGLWLDLRHLDDSVLLTATDAWTYVLVPGLATNTPTDEHLIAMVAGVDQVIDGLGDTEIHFHRAWRDLDPTAWAQHLLATATTPTAAWGPYVKRMSHQLTDGAYQEPVTYFGIRLGARGKASWPALDAGAKAWAQAVSAATGPTVPWPTPAEVQRWTAAATRVRRGLAASRLNARPATAQDMVWLFRHLQRLGTPEGPAEPWRATEWSAAPVRRLEELVADTKPSGRKSLTLHVRNQRLADRDGSSEWAASAEPTFTSHVAVLSIAEFPEETTAPFLFHASRVGFPVEVSVRVRLLANEVASRNLAKALNRQKNALEDAQDAGVAFASQDLKRARAAQALSDQIATGQSARQIVATYRLVVAAPTVERLEERTCELIRSFREDAGGEFAVEHAPTDQWRLFQELLPGQRIRTHLYEQQQDMTTFAVGWPFSTTGGGDGVGPYIGATTTGSRSPVFYDLVTAAGAGRAPTVAVTGTLGGGKSWFLNTVVDHLRLRGFPLIALDPKGDLRGQFMLRGRGDVRFFNLTADGRAGSLDPFTLVPLVVDPDDPSRRSQVLAETTWRSETRVLVMDVVDQLLREATSETMRTIVSITLDAEMQQPRPSMAHFMETLRAGGAEPYGLAIGGNTRDLYRMAAAGAYSTLQAAAQSVLGRLLFAPPDSAASGGLFAGGVTTTIVDLSGLDLPKGGQAPSSPNERFSVALFSLVAYQARRMLQDSTYVGPRALLIDEAHQITALPSGKALIVSNARMGRSRDIAMVLATQSVSDLLDDALRNVISTVFAFRTGGKGEREAVAELLGRDHDDATVARLLPDAGSAPGTCLFRDLEGQVVPLWVDAWPVEYSVAFETNPDRQKVNAAGRHIPTDAWGVVRDPDTHPVNQAAAHPPAAAPPPRPAASPPPPALVAAAPRTTTSDDGWWED